MRILQNILLTAITCFLCLMNKTQLAAVVCCHEYKGNSLSLKNRSIQVAKYNPYYPYVTLLIARNYCKTQQFDCSTGHILGLSVVLFYPEYTCRVNLQLPRAKFLFIRLRIIFMHSMFGRFCVYKCGQFVYI